MHLHLSLCCYLTLTFSCVLLTLIVLSLFQLEEDKQFAASLANEDNNLMPNNTKEVPFNDCLVRIFVKYDRGIFLLVIVFSKHSQL